MDIPQGDLGEDERLQAYPSPSTDPQDAGAYYNHDVHPHESQSHEVPVDQHEDPHTASVEELQLAAQLGQDLASEPLMPVADPNMKFDEPSLRSIMPQPEDPNMRAVLPTHHETSSHRNVMPHPEDVPPRPFEPEDTVQGAPGPAQAQLPLQHHHMSQAFPVSNDSSTPPRKRSKVSRACDECRRKKVKCDAQSDTGDSPCSNCRRSSQRCSFSRIPQKRGPSKGYIKELADRIHSIEGRLSVNTGAADNTTRKRAFSSISSSDLQTPTGLRQVSAAWVLEGRPPPTITTPERHHTGLALNGLAPQPIALKPDTPSRPPQIAVDGVIPDVSDLTAPRDVDDEVFHGYLAIIHPYLPILPTSKARLQVYLAQCSGMLREAFLEAIAGTLDAFPSFQASTSGDAGLAKKMLAEWETNDDTPRTQAAHIIHLQTVMLLLIEADVRPAGSSGTQKESLLGRAVGTAWALRLYQASADQIVDGESDSNSDIHVRVRLWWSLVLIDRWNAIATGTPTLIHKESAIARPGLNNVLGENVLLLIRLSKILERASVIVSNISQMSSSSLGERLLAGFLDDYVENIREDLPSHIEASTHPVVHLAYWHARLLAYLLDPGTRASDVLWPCKELTVLLLAASQESSPMHHHFLALTMLVLMELGRLDKTKEDANKLLAELRNLPSSPTAWEGIISDKIDEHLRQTDDGQGLLQHLADVAASSTAAVNTDGEDALSYRTVLSYEDLGFDPRPILGAGYLRVIWTSHAQS